MSINIGGIDIFRQGLDSEYRITVLEMILDKVLQKSPNLLSSQEVEQIRGEAIKLLQAKYPKAGIKQKGEEDGKK